MGRPTKTYLNAYGALYGNETPKVRGNKRSSNGVKRRQPERDEQIKLCVWMTQQGILFYAIPNGGTRHPLEAFNLKRTGLKAGVPDLCIPVPSKGFHALYIELKAPYGGLVSDFQQTWINDLNQKGNLAKVCYGFLEAKKTIADYLDLPCST